MSQNYKITSHMILCFAHLGLVLFNILTNLICVPIVTVSHDSNSHFCTVNGKMRLLSMRRGTNRALIVTIITLAMRLVTLSSDKVTN